jgi:hypothetical protein
MLSLIGGQSACVFLEPGKYSFVIHACQAYQVPCKEWTSEKYSFEVKRGTTLRYEVYATSKGPAYTGFFAAKVIK